MQEYDVALKSLLRGSAKRAIQDLTGVTVENWLDVELPKIQNLRLDLLGEAPLKMASELKGPDALFRDATIDIQTVNGERLLESSDVGDNIIAILANKMPILDDIMDHKVLGREFKRGELTLLRRMIEKKFGAVPSWADEKLAGRTAPELEEFGIRLLDAQSLEELLK